MAKHTIDIDRLTEPELRDLNRRIVERLRFLEAMRAHQRMLQFSVGDQVCFEPPGRLSRRVGMANRRGLE